ncbi:DUF2314 domain-containing protein [Stenotrophomonas sp.]|uniref:DUF2314 domain-containing protein n=1 Tax=Stenotrophomonas sp. TaxID=69392 RepID=UPI00289722BB|nr:DUF2314 domain-containing protein [Stenotrophomonas sp.]
MRLKGLLARLGIGRPDAASPEPLFMNMPDGELADLARASQKTLHHFRALLATAEHPDASPMVKTYIPDSEGKGMWLWLSVEHVDDVGFEARVFEAPAHFPGIIPGSIRFIANEEVGDWAVIFDGVLHGGYSLRLQRGRLPESERGAYDAYIGAQSYAPLPDLM